MAYGWYIAAEAGANLLGSWLSSQGSKSAAQTQSSAQQNSAQIQRDMFNTVVKQEQPFLNLGYGASTELNRLMGFPDQTPTNTSTINPPVKMKKRFGGPAGSATNPSLVTVGEDGPETLYMPPGSTGYVIPNAKTMERAKGNKKAPSHGLPGRMMGGAVGAPYNDSIGTSTIQGPAMPGIGDPGDPYWSPTFDPTTQSTTPTGPNNLPAGYLEQTFDPTQQQLNNYPGYKWQKRQGKLAVLNSDATKYGALSGAAVKDLMNYNQGLAASTYGNYFNQFQTQQNNIFNRLSTLASLGQNAAGNLGSEGANLGTGIAQANAAAGGALAGGQLGAANAWAQGTSNFGNSLPLWYFMQQGNSSDRRLKTDIERIGSTDSGIPLYRYRYKDRSEIHIGVMADEVLKVNPKAVVMGEDGYYRVNYRMIQ